MGGTRASCSSQTRVGLLQKRRRKKLDKKHFLQFSNHRSSFVRSFVAREKEKSVIIDFVILLFHFGILFAMKI